MLQKRNSGSSKGGQMNIFTNHRAFSSGWFIKWVVLFFLSLQATAELFNELQLTMLFLKHLGYLWGRKTRGRGGIKTCLKVKEFNRSGSYSFREVSEAERKSSISAGLLADKLVAHGQVETCSSAAKPTTWGQPCCSQSSSRAMPLLLPQTGFQPQWYPPCVWKQTHSLTSELPHP